MYTHRLTKTLAEHDGRTKGNLMDLLQTFETMEPNKMRWQELITMADMAMWEISFPCGIPEYPANAKRHRKMKMYGAQSSASDNQLPPEVPSFLPRFPEPHTYKVTPVNATTPIEDPKEVVEKTLEERIKVQNALAKIQREDKEVHSKAFGEVIPDKKTEDKKEDVMEVEVEQLKETTSNINIDFKPPQPADAFT